MLRSVWRACEEEVGRLVEGWKGLIGRCYPVRSRSAHSLPFLLNRRRVVLDSSGIVRLSTDRIASRYLPPSAPTY